MMESQYFIFNKTLDYKRGYLSNLIYKDRTLQLEDINKKTGYFFSRVLDSQEKELIWHRLRVGRVGVSGTVVIMLYCSNEPTVCYEEKRVRIEDILRSDMFSLNIKQELIQSFFCKQIDNGQDSLLHDVTGRYLWFYIELQEQNSESPKIEFLRFDFPKHTWISYLPEYYQQKKKSRELMERFLGIFQSLYEDMTEEIEAVTKWFHPDSATEEFLEWISQWVSIEDIPIWNHKQLNYLIQHAMNSYQIRGTIGYMQMLISLYTGGDSYIVEYHRINRYQNNQKLSKRLKQLYGEQESMFTVLIYTVNLSTAKDYQTLVRLIEHAKPAYMECRVVQLQPYIFLDQYAYLGINSRLSRYRTLQLDGLSAMNFSKIENYIGVV